MTVAVNMPRKESDDATLISALKLAADLYGSKQAADRAKAIEDRNELLRQDAITREDQERIRSFSEKNELIRKDEKNATRLLPKEAVPRGLTTPEGYAWIPRSVGQEERMREERMITRVDEKQRMRDEKKQKLEDELLTPYGLARTRDDAKKLKDASEIKESFDRKIQEMIALREKHGGGAFFNREDVERGKQLSKDVLLAYKDLAKLGVLSQADEKILNAIIPDDPLQYNLTGIIGQDPTMVRLQKFKGDVESDFQSKLKNRLRDYQGGGASNVAGQSQGNNDQLNALLEEKRRRMKQGTAGN